MSLRSLYSTDMLTLARPRRWMKFPTRLRTTTPANIKPIPCSPDTRSGTERSGSRKYRSMASPTSTGTAICVPMYSSIATRLTRVIIQ